jgi:NADH:ubiquinone oxidoreductase subunit B-like Fe-S oxidoreductase
MSAQSKQSWQAAVDSAAAWLARNTPWRMVIQEISADVCDVVIVARLLPASGNFLWETGPHEAHVLICSGPVSEEARDNLFARYEELPKPRYAIAFGTKAISRADYELCADVVTHVDERIKVDVYVLSYPPQPEALQNGIQELVRPLLAHYKEAKPVSKLESLPAEVLQRHLEQIGAPPTHEEMDRDRHLADRPPY